MMRKLFIPFLVVLIFGCNSMSNVPPKFEVSTPEHWIRKDSLTNRGYVSITMDSPLDSAKNVKGFINLSIIESADLNTSLNRNIDAIKHYSQSFEEIGSGERNINGLTGKWIRYYVGYKEIPTPLEAEVFFIPTPGYAVIVGCLAAKGHLNEFLGAFDNTLNSLKIIK